MMKNYVTCIKSILISFAFISSISFVQLASASEHPESNQAVTLVIFGSTGDLTARKLFPAVFNLAEEGELNDQFNLVGIGRRDYQNEEFRSLVYASLQNFSRRKPSKESWNGFKDHIHYHRSEFDSDEGYAKLGELLAQLDEDTGVKHRYVFYLATDSIYFPVIIKKLFDHNLLRGHDETHFSNVVIEKPFGIDLNSALELQKYISQFLNEEQIYLMDHYLGKEGMIRFEKFLQTTYVHLLDKDFVKDIEITLSETIGIGTRANFYENTGHLRDVVQNHAMQVMALATMDFPSKMTAQTMHENKSKVLNEIRPFPVDQMDQYIIRGQYGAGIVNNEWVPGYRQEKDVPDNSKVETFVQAKLFIDNNRWSGVPIYIRSGKRLAEQSTQVTYHLHDNPENLESITVAIQPKSEIYMKYNGSKHIYNVEIPESYKNREAYENLILAALKRDRSDFVDMEEVIAAWRLFTPVLNHWKSSELDPNLIYQAGQWGPEAADRQLYEDGIGEWTIINP